MLNIPDDIDLSKATPEELEQIRYLTGEITRFDQMTDDEAKLDAERRRLEASPAVFFREAWKVLEPGRDMEWSWHYDYIAEFLHAAFLGQVRRLIINVPYRTSKSNQVTISWPAWCWSRLRTMSFLCASYSDTLSRDHSVKRRRMIDSAWYQSMWPITMSKDTNRMDQYRNTSEGEMIATSVGASATGRGGDILILDDSLNTKDASSDTARETLHTWWSNTFKNRLNNPATGVIIVIEQRTHQMDMTGFLERTEGTTDNGGQWTKIVVPTECESPTTYTYPLSGHVHVREEGDIIQPKRHTAEVIAARKVHATAWATQDQQRPSPPEGIIFKRKWWKRYNALPAKVDQFITSFDFAVEDEKRSDYNCGVCAARVGADTYIIDCKKVRGSFSIQLQFAKDFIAKHRYALRHLVEKKANGPAIVSTLKSKITGIIEIPPQGSKIQRAEAASPDCESGNVYLPEDAPWVADFIETLANFPNAAFDDEVDAFDQAINWLRTNAYSYGLLAWDAQQFILAQQKENSMLEKTDTGGMTKPDLSEQTVRCPQCKSTAVRRIANSFHCNNCSNQWSAVSSPEFESKLFTRTSTMHKATR